MPHLVQIVLDPEELLDVEAASRRRCLSVPAWVRAAIREALRQADSSVLDRKLAALQQAAEFARGPAGNIDAILADIERGRSS